MRARSLRPTFDRLDVRLVLDGGASVVTGTGAVAAMVPAANANLSTIIPPTTWFLDGVPPPSNPNTDPNSSLIPIPWDNLTT